MIKLVYRLTKLAVYVGIGYVLYEIVVGMLKHAEENPAPAPANPVPPPAPAPAAEHHDEHRTAAGTRTNMTGSSGAGRAVPVDDFGGGTRRQRVGRGVVSR